MQGKGVLVSGATCEMGHGVVLAAVARGASVVFCGPPGSRSTGTVIERECHRVTAWPGVREPGDARYVEADPGSETQVDRLFDFVIDQLPQLDVLIMIQNPLPEQSLLETSLEDWSDAMATNLRGPFLLCRRGIMEFMGTGGGRIVHVTSAVRDGAPNRVRCAASASGLRSFARTVAKEYGRHKISCNGVVHGELGQPGLLRDAVEAILFLASEDASFVNGEELCLTGGGQEFLELRGGATASETDAQGD